MNTASAPPQTRRRRRWSISMIAVGVLVAVIAAVGGPIAYRSFEQGRQLRAALAELDAADPHWRLEDLEARRADVPAAENSAGVIRAARALIPRLTPEEWRAREPLLGHTETLVPNVRLTAEQYHIAIEALEDVEPVVRIAQVLAELPRGRHSMTYSKDGVSTLLRHADDMSQVDHGVLRLLLLVHAEEGDAAAAVRDSLCLLNLGCSIGDEPFLVSQMIRAARGTRAAVYGVERALGQGEAPDAELARLQKRLTEEIAHDAWVTGLRGERATAHRAMQAVADGTIRASHLRAMSSRGARPAPNDLAGQIRAWLDDRFPGDLALAHSTLLRGHTRLLAETRPLPWHERAAKVNTILAEIAAQPEIAEAWLAEVPKRLASIQNGQARARCGLVLIAAERYRMRHGRWPDASGALVPDLLAAVPTDPFDGQPVRLKRVADGVVVYCVGADGQDDAGKLGDGNQQQGGDDVGVRLWDVARRRQPPPGDAP